MSNLDKTSVIIVGGSLVGLSTALFLSNFKVPVILLERHAGSSPHPRAIGYTARTLEIFRAMGIESRLPESKFKGGPPRRVVVESLTGKWQDEQHWTPKPAGAGPGKNGGKPKGQDEYSPVSGIASAQDKIEPVLREAAIEKGADLRLGWKVTNWTQNDDGVTVTAVNKDGKEQHIEGKYLVACDGARSPIREQLGIKRDGIEGREDGFKGFMTNYGQGRWALMWNPTEGSTPSKDDATQKDFIRKAIGKEIPDSDIDIITTGEWDLSGLIADKFSSGRIFLAGDAAHALPPNRGGYGANTGISDAHNLAWKLAAVLTGASSPELLETYDAERRPVALVRHDQIFVRDDYQRFLVDREWKGEGIKILDDSAVEFGQIYKSGAVIGAGDDLPPAKRPDEWNGQAGTRAPHISMRRGGDIISSLDLFCQGWVLISKDEAWKATIKDAGEATGVECSFVQVGNEIDEVKKGGFGESFGVDDTGAVLVRPDGYIAWKMASGSEDRSALLKEALGKTSYSVKHSA
ncbi:phenol 2-monooxygenase [Fusarium albosuccineum]|uniref:Phenol 2-monooxygenase n=1 Tax=Fusarium albosuccineum TaxID=1237068 RepID=A0A8H4LDS7_9HYPO|nr:phenol 2-monooxygenase [Fusarium albosuccineum]